MRKSWVVLFTSREKGNHQLHCCLLNLFLFAAAAIAVAFVSFLDFWSHFFFGRANKFFINVIIIFMWMWKHQRTTQNWWRIRMKWILFFFTTFHLDVCDGKPATVCMRSIDFWWLLLLLCFWKTKRSEKKNIFSGKQWTFNEIRASANTKAHTNTWQKKWEP